MNPPLSQKKRLVPVVFAANDGYVSCLRTAIYSLCRSASAECDYRVYILYTSLSRDNRILLEELPRKLFPARRVTVNCLDVGDSIDALSGIIGERAEDIAHISEETYYRFLIPELFSCYERVIYLDCDLVLLDDIALLLDCAVPGAAICGAVNASSGPLCRYIEQKLCIPAEKYINAGVLIWNTKLCRDAGIIGLCRGFAGQKLRMLDQDLMNLALNCGEISRGIIDMRWNLQWHPLLKDDWNLSETVSDMYFRALSKPAIIHYTSGKKPWDMQNAPLAAYYVAFARAAGTLPGNAKKPAASGKPRPAVSVIIPAYNAADYLNACLDSVLAQSCRSMEIICIDDGSDDATPSILAQYASRDDRLRVISLCHSGAGAARNAGLDDANGEYLYFLDADDCLCPGALETALSAAQKASADMLVFDAFVFDGRSGETREATWYLDRRLIPPKRPFAAREFPDAVFSLSGGNVWTKLYRADYIASLALRFQDIPGADDTYFSMLASAMSSATAVCCERLVRHRVNNSAGQMSNSAKYPMSQFKAFLSVKHKLVCEGIFPAYERSFINRAARNCLRALRLMKSYDAYSQFYEMLRAHIFRALGIADRPRDDFFDGDIYEKINDIIRMPPSRESHAIHSVPPAIPGKNETAPETAGKPVVEVSVIIPVHNAARYLGECLDSLTDQTLQAAEFILVNDGSDDNSADIIASYAARDSRIRVINQLNMGAAAARNAGLAAARGANVMFLDADDVFDAELLSRTNAAITSSKADILIFDAFRFKDATKEKSTSSMLLNRRFLPDKQVFSRKDIPEHILNITLGVAWNKLYSARFLREKNLSFQSLANSNGVCFTICSLALADKVAALKERLVYYRTGNPESTVGRVSEHPFCFLEAWREIKKKLRNTPDGDGGNLFDTLRQSYVNAAAFYCMNRLGEMKTRDAFETLYPVLRAELPHLLDGQSFGMAYFHYDFLAEWYGNITSYDAETYIRNRKVELRDAAAVSRR